MNFVERSMTLLKKFFQHDLIWALARICVFMVLKKRGLEKRIRGLAKKSRKVRSIAAKQLIWSAARICAWFYLKFKGGAFSPYWRPVAMGAIALLIAFPVFFFFTGGQEPVISDAQQKEETPYGWVSDENFIAHGMGAVKGLPITNSLEAFTENYKAGYRIFEVDLVLTADNVLVLRHDNGRFVENEDGETVHREDPMTYEEFMELKPGDDLTPLSFEDLVNIMAATPDVRIITDTKLEDADVVRRQFDQITQVVNQVDPTMISRITPQFYSESMYEQLRDGYGFETYIYTLYMTDSATETVAEFMNRNNLPLVTIPDWLVTQEIVDTFAGRGITAFVHTVETASRLEELATMGVDGYYTDYLDLP